MVLKPSGFQYDQKVPKPDVERWTSGLGGRGSPPPKPDGFWPLLCLHKVQVFASAVRRTRAHGRTRSQWPRAKVWQTMVMLQLTLASGQSM